MSMLSHRGVCVGSQSEATLFAWLPIDGDIVVSTGISSPGVWVSLGNGGVVMLNRYIFGHPAFTWQKQVLDIPLAPCVLGQRDFDQAAVSWLVMVPVAIALGAVFLRRVLA